MTNLFDEGKQIAKAVAKRTIIAIAIAVLCTCTVIALLTVFDVLPAERLLFELFISAAITVAVTAIVAPIVFWKIFQLIHKLDAAKTDLRLQAEKDFLTKLANRRGLKVKAGTLIDHAAENKQPVSMVILDIDNFKVVNDTYGHQAGDEVICAAAQAILQVIDDFKEFEVHAARVGGRNMRSFYVGCIVESLQIWLKDCVLLVQQKLFLSMAIKSRSPSVLGLRFAGMKRQTMRI